MNNINVTESNVFNRQDAIIVDDFMRFTDPLNGERVLNIADYKEFAQMNLIMNTGDEIRQKFVHISLKTKQTGEKVLYLRRSGTLAFTAASALNNLKARIDADPVGMAEEAAIIRGFIEAWAENRDLFIKVDPKFMGEWKGSKHWREYNINLALVDGKVRFVA